jgi:REP-associated tyrosine transposase
VAHVARSVDARHPLHVTLRVRPEVWNLRSRRSWKVLRRAFYACLPREGSRVAHFSIQGNHIHLLVEADDRAKLGNMMQVMSIRMARGLNRLMGRKRGTVFADRYHARSLTTPTETRHALLYVIQNAKKHLGQLGKPLSLHWIDDEYSSALYFRGWREAVPAPREPLPVSAPESWLLDRGWLLAGGPISRAEAPRS